MRYAPSTGLPLPGISIIIFVVVLVVFIVMAIILSHHWQKYEVDRKRIKHLKRIFFGVGVILLFLILITMFPLLT